MGLVRVALALAVLLGHLPLVEFKFMNAALAVQSFFIVSGFYMGLVLEGKYKDARLFYSNRLLRLAPTYFTMCALYAIALFALNASATSDTGVFANAFHNPVTALIMALENIAILGQELLFWFTIDGHGALVFNGAGALPDAHISVAWQALLVPQSWSLSIELIFYALAPLLARLSWRWLVAIAAASIALRLAGHALPVSYGLWQGRFFPTELFLFIFGMLGQRLSPLAAKLPKATGWIVNLALLAMIVALPLLKLHGEPVGFAIYGLIALAIPFVFNAFKDFTLDRWIGDLSYPLYLTHLLVIGLVLTFMPNAPYAAAVAIGGSLLLSVVVLVVAEHPIDRWRQARAQKGVEREIVVALKPA